MPGTKRRLGEANCEGQDPDKIFGPGGHDNPLKRLISAKRIQGNPSFFLCFSLPGLARALLDFEQFGVDLDQAENAPDL
jgi:hypothetical protein